jgi:hypothetical protein
MNGALRIEPDVPLIQLWCGNFFEPWLSHRAQVNAVRRERWYRLD